MPNQTQGKFVQILTPQYETKIDNCASPVVLFLLTDMGNVYFVTKSGDMRPCSSG